MKKLQFVFVALSLLSVSAFAKAADFEVDPVHSSVNFEIRHIMSNLRGTFGDFNGTFSFDETKPEASKIKFTVKTASINTANPKRDEHLKSPDFFDVAKFPESSFVSKSVTFNKADKTGKIEGDFTLHGVTKPVTFDVSYLGQTNVGGAIKAGFEATAKINRKDFGIIWNKALDNGGVMIGEDVKLTIDVEASPKKAK